jgi:hypothetical protein
MLYLLEFRSPGGVSNSKNHHIMGEFHGSTRYYPRLPAAREECERSATCFQAQAAEGFNVGALTFAGERYPVSLETLTKLRPGRSNYERRWDLVHFAGHTDSIGNYFRTSRSYLGSRMTYRSAHSISRGAQDPIDSTLRDVATWLSRWCCGTAVRKVCGATDMSKQVPLLCHGHALSVPRS